MKFAAVFALVSALAVNAMPTAYPIFTRAMNSRNNGGPTDTQILQYALTLENLEKKFYADALAKFSADDFKKAGYPDWVRGRFSQIATHEAEHTALLSGALGKDSVAPCEYKFPYTDVASFISLAALIENVGVSAYAGAAQYITEDAYLTVAAVILSTEARHQSWQTSSVLKQEPWSSAYDTPLGLNMVYTIASQFIVSCPSSNAMLPVKAYATLSQTAAQPGSKTTFTFDHKAAGKVNYAIWYSGLGSKAVQLDNTESAVVPKGLQGIGYVLISTASSAADVTDSNIVAGPAIWYYPFDAFTANPAFMG